MKTMKTLQDFQQAIEQRWSLYQKVQGRFQYLNPVNALNLKVLDLLVLINNGDIAYSIEY